MAPGDVLVNNVAIAAPERHTLTADGNEIAFQGNSLAHYLLTNVLEPALTSDYGERSPRPMPHGTSPQEGASRDPSDTP